jgi:hypothetical protein
MAGVAYSPEDRNGSGRGMSTMGNVPAMNNPMPRPVQPKNGEAQPIDQNDQINQGVQGDTPLLDQFNTQPIPDEWPQ